MADHDNRTVICSVAFIDIVEYSKKSVEEQMRVKEQLNDLLVQSLAEVPADERIILDTGDGVAISFLGDPEESLYFGLALRDALAARNGDMLRLRTGINVGPVRLVRDINGQPNIIGDGINVAQRIMSFAGINQTLVSRSFFDVISALSADYARLFAFEGARTDKHVREHEVYSLGTAPAPQRAPRQRARSIATFANTGLRNVASAASLARFRVMRHPPLATALAVGVILLGAVALRLVLHQADTEPPTATTAETAEEAPPPVLQRPEPSFTSATTALPESAVEPPPQPKAKVVPEPLPEARPREQPVPAATGTVRFQIIPWGEVHVNGENRGAAPPLRDIALKVGTHRIEVLNPGFAPYREVIDVKPGQEIKIRHRFR